MDRKLVYVVAVSQKEADTLAEIGHDTMKEANEHLRRVKAPPTDPFYAAMYKVFKVNK